MLWLSKRTTESTFDLAISVHYGKKVRVWPFRGERALVQRARLRALYVRTRGVVVYGCSIEIFDADAGQLVWMGASERAFIKEVLATVSFFILSGDAVQEEPPERYTRVYRENGLLIFHKYA